ncbi:MAG: hypothetical protein IJS15_06690 [Victivallales bacterium]|nr:hypothetical protein [Victivallales bacterium]
MIDCKTVEEKIVSGEPLDVDSELHLLGCRSCQAFAHVHNAAVGLPGLSNKTDAAAMAAFHASSSRPAMRAFRKVAAIAACLAVLLALTQIHWRRHDDSSAFTLSTEEQWMLGYSLDNDDLAEMELSLSEMELPLMASASTSASSSLSPTALHYEIISLEMDLSFQ